MAYKRWGVFGTLEEAHRQADTAASYNGIIHVRISKEGKGYLVRTLERKLSW